MNDRKKILFDKLVKDRTESAAVLEKTSMKGVKYSVTEKYSEQAHFIYELIQNADDVKATDIKFILSPKGLCFKHNGKDRFTVSDIDTEDLDKQTNSLGHINSITSIGQSSKTENQSKIGKFGVGFKAVFQYTDEPEIYEKDLQFRITRFIIPELINESKFEVNENETLFYFPFKGAEVEKTKAYHEILSKISNLHYPLLFVSNLKTIRWETEDKKEGLYQQTILDKINENNTNIEKIRYTYTSNDQLIGENDHYFLKLSRFIDNGLAYSVVYRTDANKKVLSDVEIPTFCFFPTTEINKLRFILHAPFLLIDNRQGIKRNNEWNTKLIENLALLAGDSLTICKDLGYVNDDFFFVIPHTESDFDNTVNYFYKPIYIEILKRLKTIPIFPTKDGDQYLEAKNSFLGTKDLVELFESKQLANLLGRLEIAWILPSIAGAKRRGDGLDNYLLKQLGIKELNAPDIAYQLNAEFIEKQTEDWLHRFYKYVSSIPSIFKELRTKAFLIAEDDKAYSLIDENLNNQIFMPTVITKSIDKNNENTKTIKADESISLIAENETGFIFIKESLLRIEDTKKFLIGFGLKELDTRAFIEKKIIPLYATEGSLNTVLLKEHFEFFCKYYEECPRHEQFNFIQKLKAIPFVIVTSLDTNKLFGVQSHSTYYPTPELLKFYENFETKIYWFKEAEYEYLFEKLGKNLILDFLKDLGVHFYPQQTVFAPANPYEYLSEVSYTQLEGIIDYEIIGLNNAITNINLEKSNIIWNFLINSNYKFDSEIEYFYYIYRIYNLPANFFQILNMRQWLYNTDNKLVRPIDIKFQDLHNQYNTQTYKAKEFINYLKFYEETIIEEVIKIEDSKKYKEVHDKFKDFTDEDIRELVRLKIRREKRNQAQGLNANADITTAKVQSESKKVFNPTYENIDDLISDLSSIKGKSQNQEIENIISTALTFIENELKSNLETAKEVFEKVERDRIEYEGKYNSINAIQEFGVELAHIILTSVGSISRMAEFIKKELPNPDFDSLFISYANGINDMMNSLSNIVNFMLDVNKKDSYEELELKSLIGGLFEYDYKNKLEQNNIFSMVELLDEFRLVYNRKAIEDVIENLITNSIKATRYNEKEKIIKCKAYLENENYMILFSDNGGGIDPEIKDRIFEIYQTTTQDIGGSGVGLFIVKTRLEAIGGRISIIDSEFSTGATFQIILPVKNKDS